MRVRTREESDLPELAEILERVYKTDGYPVEGISDPRGWLIKPGLLEAWTAIDNANRVIGQVFVAEVENDDKPFQAWCERHSKEDPERLKSRVACLARLFVDPAARGQGAGTALMETAIRWAHGHGRRLILNVLLKDPAAVKAYERGGWEKYGEGIHTNWKGKDFEQWYYVNPVSPIRP